MNMIHGQDIHQLLQTLLVCTIPLANCFKTYQVPEEAFCIQSTLYITFILPFEVYTDGIIKTLWQHLSLFYTCMRVLDGGDKQTI